MRLSPNFTLAELTRTDTGLDNTPKNANEWANLKQLAMNLEHVRAIIGKPVIITSAFRSEAVNRKVRGSLTSHHRFGFAADFVIQGTAVFEVVSILDKSWLHFDQLINEQEKGITHISFAPLLRREVLTQKGQNFVKGNEHA
jgi:zinc D-Ala-D-Ala carboxypeptidase